MYIFITFIILVHSWYNILISTGYLVESTITHKLRFFVFGSETEFYKRLKKLIPRVILVPIQETLKEPLSSEIQ